MGIYLASILEEDTERREDDGKEDVDAGSCAVVGHFVVQKEKSKKQIRRILFATAE